MSNNKKKIVIIVCFIVSSILVGILIGYSIGIKSEKNEVSIVTKLPRGTYGQMPEDTFSTNVLTIDNETIWIYDESKLQHKASVESVRNNLFKTTSEEIRVYYLGEYLLLLQGEEGKELEIRLYKFKTPVATFYEE